MNELDYNDKKILVNNIKNLNKKDLYKQIFILLLENNIKYTNNKNGIFFNINNLNDSLIKKINEIIIS
tara:strand:- start:640 stop:843 length:204 start_codon:yes stop_codon:yes gene_type:complete